MNSNPDKTKLYFFSPSLEKALKIISSEVNFLELFFKEIFLILKFFTKSENGTILIILPSYL